MQRQLANKLKKDLDILNKKIIKKETILNGLESFLKINPSIEPDIETKIKQLKDDIAILTFIADDVYKQYEEQRMHRFEYRQKYKQK